GMRAFHVTGVQTCARAILDRVSHFVAGARVRTAAYGSRVTVREGDMAEVTGPYDFIWCAGGIYFLGVTEGLRIWRRALAPGGRVDRTSAARGAGGRAVERA